ncbi:sulfurtransferase [Burkholderia oklahomensis C6786]|nr:sulfurtransferase [Burkholderia oklahomensis C6786]KUY62380.1 sulfurtransferase [Burkholderia oklahomensis C6786]MBI0362334.1 rhodanese homology domain-containing protein [Burkholderia oklahomensis]QPS41790.1 rhodanese homology domain-containing protein [Burkholderia oklahomensis]
MSAADVRAALLAGAEIALIDVREEDPYAHGHPLWAANFPLSKLELEAWTRIPRRDTTIAIYGEALGEDLAPRAAAVLAALGYTRVHRLEGGLAGWQAAGGELFIDVNVPSKAFGELVDAKRHTPSLSAHEVKQLIDARADVVIVDARRFDEYQTMSIPTATSVPGAELVLRVRELAPDPATRVIVNCAGRTRSIIGAQSLINAGLPNPVAALRNGTIGWTLAGQTLDRGASRRFPEHVEAERREAARRAARDVARRAGVARIALRDLRTLESDDRTLYRFDVRTPDEYAAGHLPGFASAPGGQLVQETDHHAPVRGARIVLADDDGVRADMSASWLAQMGWDVSVVEPADARERSERGQPAARTPQPAESPTVSVDTLAEWLGVKAAEGDAANRLAEGHASRAGASAQDARVREVAREGVDENAGRRADEQADEQADEARRESLAEGSARSADASADVAVIDVTTSANYVKRHIPGAWYAVRAQLRDALTRIPSARRYVLTCGSGQLAAFAAADLRGLLPEGASVYVLDGGTLAWLAAGLPVEGGETRLASPRIDRYRRPYEGTGNAAEAMQAYLDWEFGLVEQLGRDGTHRFEVL